MSVYRIDIAVDHPCFAGHFPGFPVLPAVAQFSLLTEALAAVHGRPCTIEAIPVAKFLQPVAPGDSLRVEIESDDANAASFVLRHGEVVVSKGRMRYRMAA